METFVILLWTLANGYGFVSILNWGELFVQRSLTSCIILETFMRNYFEFSSVVKEELSFKSLCYLNPGGCFV